MITIQISDDSWEKLNQMKKPGQTFEEVLKVILQQSENMQKSSAGNNQGVEEAFSPDSKTSTPSQSKRKK